MKTGSTLPVHKVKCRECGREIEKKTHWRSPRCDDCQPWRAPSYSAGYYRDLRKQARRYRIIMHYLGWEEHQFAEMITEMRHSPMAFRKQAEGRDAHYDLSIERKRRSA